MTPHLQRQQWLPWPSWYDSCTAHPGDSLRGNQRPCRATTPPWRGGAGAARQHTASSHAGHELPTPVTAASPASTQSGHRSAAPEGHSPRGATREHLVVEPRCCTAGTASYLPDGTVFKTRGGGGPTSYMKTERKRK